MNQNKDCGALERPPAGDKIGQITPLWANKFGGEQVEESNVDVDVDLDRGRKVEVELEVEVDVDVDVSELNS